MMTEINVNSNANSNSRRGSGAPGSSGEVKFKTTMKITKKDDGGSIFYKFDGERFRSGETIKLHSGVQYRVILEFKPSMELSSLKVAGLDTNFKLINNSETDSKSIYEFTWSTYGIDPTSAKHRADIPVALKFKNYKTLTFSLQCKFYKSNDETHVSWGKALNGIGVQCVVRRGSDLSTADSIKFS